MLTNSFLTLPFYSQKQPSVFLKTESPSNMLLTNDEANMFETLDTRCKASSKLVTRISGFQDRVTGCAFA